MGESESLSANPSESHLCFSPAHLWPFSSSLLPNSMSVRSWGGTGEAGRGRRKRGNIFLWMFPVVPNVRKCFQARRSRGAFFFYLFFFSANTGGQAILFFIFLFCFVSGWPLRANRQALTNLIATRLCQMWETQGSRAKTSRLRKQGHSLICHKRLFCLRLCQIHATSACLSLSGRMRPADAKFTFKYI